MNILTHTLIVLFAFSLIASLFISIQAPNVNKRCISSGRKRSVYSSDSRKYISTTRGNGVRGGRRGNGRGRGPIDDNMFRCPQCDHINRKAPAASKIHINFYLHHPW